jgi:hypothetical protein
MSTVETVVEEPQALSESVMPADASEVAPYVDVYLSYHGNKAHSIATAQQGAWPTQYWFPTTGFHRVKVKLGFHGPLKEGVEVKILSTESQLGDYRVLGAFSDRKECYYWTDTQGSKQLWQVNPLKPGQPVRYGDRVIFTNKDWAQQLVPDGGWLTTQKIPGAEPNWVIEKA